MINVLDANRPSISIQVEEPLQSKPCTRRKDNSLDNIDLRGLSSRRPIPNNNFKTLNIVSKPSSLKINDVNNNNPEGEEILLHSHGDFDGNHFIITQDKSNNEDVDIANYPKPLLVDNVEDIKDQLFPLKPQSNNELDNKVTFDDTFEAKSTNPNMYDYNRALFNKIKQKKTENAVNVIVKRPTYVPKTIEVQPKKTSNDDYDDCESTKLKNDEDTSNNRRFFTSPKKIEHNIQTEVFDPNVNADEINENNRIAFENNELLDPTKGAGITDLSSSPVNLLRHSRVCYACSTVTNPTCQEPDRRTTVKYCRQGHEACVTKTFLTSRSFKISKLFNLK
ncbi:unnamed protein product [Diatraea saccharalis]|uniref:Uncharacterized protein n=1 Tax=Diatraea saccharalis TaxID=40085 RepID=A0A9N9R3J1_9NEOP|nr:unnamed protein product [Diatraea saccharalis]